SQPRLRDSPRRGPARTRLCRQPRIRHRTAPARTGTSGLRQGVVTRPRLPPDRRGDLQVVTSLQKIPAFSLSVIPAEAGILSSGASSWKIPAYAGMTGELIGNDENQPCRHPRGIYPVIPAEAGI